MEQKGLGTLKINTEQKWLGKISDMDEEGLGNISNMEQKGLGTLKVHTYQEGSKNINMDEKGGRKY